MRSDTYLRHLGTHMFEIGHDLPPESAAKYLATRNTVLSKYTTDDEGNRQYQFLRCTVCGMGVYDREKLSPQDVKDFLKRHDGDDCSTRFDSVRYIFDPAGVEPIKRRNRQPKTTTKTKTTSEDPQPVAVDDTPSSITWTVQSISVEYPGLFEIEEDEESDSDDDEEEVYEKQIKNRRNEKMRSGAINDDTIRYMFDAVMKTKKYNDTLLKVRNTPGVKSGQDPKYVEAMAEIAKMENEKRLMEEKMERMQKHIEMLEHTVKHEIQKQEQVHEALDEWGMRDSVLERAKEIASVFTKNA